MSILIWESNMEEQRKPLLYLGGDIMTRGSNLARQEEYDKFIIPKSNLY